MHQQRQQIMQDSSDDSDHSTSLLASGTLSEVPRSAVVQDDASPLLYDQAEEDDASIVVIQQQDPTPSQHDTSPLPSTQTATQRGRKKKGKGTGKGRGRGKDPETSSAMNPQPGRSLITTAEMEEGPGPQQATKEAALPSPPQETQETQETPAYPSTSAAGQVIHLFTRDQEEQLVEWFRDHSLFYDKTCPDYKNTQKKERLVMDISNRLGLSVASVLHWKTSMRTQYGKVKNKRSKSGQATQPPTPRQQWTLRSFSFLDSHLRVQSQSLTLGMVSNFSNSIYISQFTFICHSHAFICYINPCFTLVSVLQATGPETIHQHLLCYFIRPPIPPEPRGSA